MKKLNIFLLTGIIFLQTHAQLNTSLSYTIRSSVNAGKVLTGGNPVTGNPQEICLHQISSRGNNNMLWRVEDVAGGFYKIKNKGTGKYLAVSGGSREAGMGTILWVDQGQPDIIWQVIQSGDARSGFSYKFLNRNSNFYLAVEGGSTADGAPVVQYMDQGQADIVWKLAGIYEGVLTPPAREIAPAKTLTRAEWMPLFTRALSGFKININNYTPDAYSVVHNDTYKFMKRMDCLFKFDRSEAKFGVIAFRIDPATVYFIDLNSLAPTIIENRNGIEIELSYEHEGHEVLGNCINNINCGGGMWWIDIHSFHVNLVFTPVMENGKIAYSNLTVKCGGAIFPPGSDNIVRQNLANQVLFAKLADQIKRNMDHPELREIFSTGLTEAYLRILSGGGADILLPAVLPYRSIRLLSNGSLQFD
jgi:hypothetical protein